MTNALPKNELLHSFGLYNAIVVAHDGTRIHWNNTLGFSLADDSEPLPVVDISDRPNILAVVDEWMNGRQ